MKKNRLIIDKMTKQKTLLVSFLSILMLLTMSCNDLTEVNTSSNELSASDIDIKYVLTAAQSESSYSYIHYDVYGATTTFSEAMQYLQRDYIDYSGPNTLIWSALDLESYSAPIVNSQYLIDNADSQASEDNQNFYTAVGQILRSFWYGYMTSVYGDVPYSEAMQAEEGNYTPVYDSQIDIFIGILDDLESANTTLAGISSTIDDASDADLMYGGDPEQWQKFANSLRLRFLMRLSEKLTEMSSAEVDVKSLFSTIIGNSSTYPIFTSNSDNAYISYPGTSSDNSWYGGPLNWTNRSEYYRRKPCATFVDELREDKDPRLTTFILPVDCQLVVDDAATIEYEMLSDGQIVRYISSSDSASQDYVNTYRYVGLPPALPDPDAYNLSSSTSFSSITALNSDVYTDNAANPHVSYLGEIYAENSNSLVNCVLMSYAELNFLLAEARLKGWITSGTAVDYYSKGVEASLDQYEIADGSTTVYDQTTEELVAFDETEFFDNLETEFSSADDDGQLELLMIQKWIASFMTPEFWFDWRRTGLPDFGSNLISGSNGTKIPVRHIYGDDEKIVNATNVEAAITTLSPASDEAWSKMWLLQDTDNPW